MMIQEKKAPATDQASIVYLMQNFANYNLWANTTLVNWLRTKPEAELEREMSSSFPSIKLTLHHIWQTQRYWLSIIRRDQAETYRDDAGSSKDVLDLIVEQSEELADFVGRMTKSALEDTTMIVSPWFQCDFQHFEYLVQVMNHSTYHRGQIITIGRQLGYEDAPMTDYNYYNIYGK